jgi:hypothetical protein
MALLGLTTITPAGPTCAECEEDCTAICGVGPCTERGQAGCWMPAYLDAGDAYDQCIDSCEADDEVNIDRCADYCMPERTR